MVAIQTNAIGKQFTTTAGPLSVLEDITFSVESGHIVAIVGKSGSGKSTLLNIISGLEEPTSGSVQVDGVLGYVPQKDVLLPWRTVVENILLPTEIASGDLDAALTYGRDLLARNDLTQFATAYPNEISGGMRQKVSLVRALVHNPDVMLFDESFSAVDFATRLQLVKEIRAYIVSTQKAAIFVTHNIEEAIAIADTLIVFSERPAQIVYSTAVDIPDAYRDPVNVRKSRPFQDIFETVWHVLHTHV